jgi:hypothetical protein
MTNSLVMTHNFIFHSQRTYLWEINTDINKTEHETDKAANHLSLTRSSLFDPQVSPCGIWSEQSGFGTVFLQKLLFSHVILIPPKFHTHISFIYRQRRIISAKYNVVEKKTSHTINRQ